MTEQPFGTESDPQHADPAPEAEAATPAPEVAGQQPPEHPAPTVPDNQPSWLKDVFTYFHDRLRELEQRLPH